MRVLILSCGLILATVSLNAATIHVPSDQPTIQAGIDSAGANDTVLVAPGTYTETLTYPLYRVIVLSSSGADFTFLYHPGGSETLVRIPIADSGSVFDGFTISGVSSGTHVIHAVGQVDYFEIKNNRFLDLGISSNVIQGGGGASVLVSYNLFSNFGLANVTTTQGGDCSFINNTVDSGGRGLAIYGPNATILNNIVVNVTGYAILNPDPSSVVDYNDFWNNGSNNEPGPNGISADPKFVYVSADDYNLVSSSPCIDAGHPDPQYFDPDSTRNDIGAFPSGGSTVTLPWPDKRNVGEEYYLNVVNHSPTFYWTFYDTIGSQAGYEVEVGTDDDWSIAEMWATGEVFSSDTFAVYAGAVLEDGVTYVYRVRVNNGLTWGGWAKSVFRMNSLPSIPVLSWPIAQRLTSIAGLRLAVDNSVDPELDVLTYDFEVYSDPGATVLVYSEYGVEEELLGTRSDFVVGLLVDTEYWWRCRASDGYEYSDWSSLESFITRAPWTIHVPSDQPTIQAGIDSAGANDTVLVAPGTYTETLTYPLYRVIVLSSSGADFTFLYHPGGSETLVRIPIADSGSVFDGFTISGVSSGTHVIHAVGQVDYFEIKNNRFLDLGISSNVIQGGGGASVLVSYNLFSNFGLANVTTTQGGDCSFINNTVDSGGRGLAIYGPNATILNNIVVNVTGYAILNPDPSSVVDYNDFWNNGSNNEPGPNGISADPKFVYVSADDYNLVSSSPCIDAGHPDPQYFDPDSTRNDIGAFPYLQGNAPPVLDSIGPKEVNEGALLSFLVSASDPDGTTPELSTSVLPDSAVFADSGNGTGGFEWTPTYAQAGTYEITFYATDDSLAQDSEVVSITVNDVNRSPVLDSIRAKEVFEGDSLEFVISASDPDGDSVVLSAVNLPANASFADSGNGHGLFTFDPDFTQSGVDTVIFIVSDTILADSEQVVMTIHDGDPAVQNLLIDGQDIAQHVVDHTPIIEWVYSEPTGERPQTQFEIAVGNDSDWAFAEMWNPAPFASPDTSVVYGGAVLVDGDTYYLRLRVNNGMIWSEWHETAFRMNTVPSEPVPLHPVSDEMAGSTATLWLQNSSDAEGDSLTYEYGVFSDSLGSSLVTSTTGVAEATDSTGWTVDMTLDENTRYWWRGRAFDGYEHSIGSGLVSFWVNENPEPPTAPQANFPPDTGGLPVFDMLPTFLWSESTDPDPLDTVRYKLEIAVDSNFTFVATIDSIESASYTVVDSLDFNEHYWWRVTAFDNTGLSTLSANTPDFWTWTLGDVDHSHGADVGDLTYLVAYLFQGGQAIYPLFIGDVDGSCTVDVGDLTYLVAYLFQSGPAPKVGCASRSEKHPQIGVIQ